MDDLKVVQGVKTVPVKETASVDPMEKVRKSAKSIKAEKGRSVFLTRFKNYHLTFQPDEDVVRGGKVVGKTKDRVLKFNDGAYATSDPEEIEFIRGLNNFGREIVEVAHKAAEAPAA